jgi:hypothetical protein
MPRTLCGHVRVAYHITLFGANLETCHRLQLRTQRKINQGTVAEEGIPQHTIVPAGNADSDERHSDHKRQ